MNESLRTAAVEGEAPVNPYSLLEAVNASSDTAHTGWLIFIAIMSYLLVAVAGVTHKDLLLSSDIALPILQVRIDLTRFFLFAPILLVLFHLGVVAQLVMLARKTLEFDTAIRMLEVTDRRTHPLRLELHNFFFVQAIAGPERSPVMSVFLHAMSWLTLVFLPVVLLLYVQVAFLPYHDETITWAHRVALTADMAMLILIGIFLTRAETSFLTAVGQTTRRHPFSFGLTCAVLLLVAFFSFLVATVPGEPLDRVAQVLTRSQNDRLGVGDERAAAGFAVPFLGARADGSLFGLFQRNLIVTDLDLVVDKDVTAEEPSLVLRGRDLRYARLDRTDLHQSDLTGADLNGASLVGADLRRVLLQCSDVSRLILGEDRNAAKCPSARGANLTRAKLKDARMAGIDLTGARLEEADLEGAELAYATLAGASFYAAHLERADLTGGVWAQGANFATASLQGADLAGARLAGADFTSAGLQGASLIHGRLIGATLRDADLEGADLSRARLQGSDLSGAKIRAADLGNAWIWLTLAPDRESVVLADLSELAMKPLSERDVAQLERLLARTEEPLRGRLKEKLAGVLGPQARTSWNDADQQAWQVLSTASAAGLADNYKGRLTDHLARLSCKARWSDGSVATGVARRALRADFKGDMPSMFDRLRASDCPASKTLPQPVLRNLATAADVARGN
jgi:uncharacterized protein YjbI with pentapeptide repeats